MFQDNQRQDLSYDADRNVTHTPSYNYAGGSVVSFRDWTYDAAGQMAQVKETVTVNNSVSTYITNQDGDGQPISEYFQQNLASKTFMVRSSVLGGKVLTRLDNTGNKSSTIFDVDGLLTAAQNVYSSGSSLRWTHIDPLGLSEAGDTKAVYDPMGNYIQWQHAPTAPPNAYPPTAASFGGLGSSFGSAQDKSCVFNGQPISCTELRHQIDIGNVAIDILLGIQHVEVPITPLGLGMFGIEFSRWVPEQGTKNGQAKDDPDNYIVRVNIDQEGKGHYERFLLSVQPGEPQNSSGKLSHDEISHLLDDLLSLIHQNEGCEEGLNKFLGQLAKSTGFNAGKITDVIETFRKSGIAYLDDKAGEPGSSGGGSAGTGLGGVPSISFSQGGTRQNTLLTFLAEMTHWAGMPHEGKPGQAENHGYANYYQDADLAKAGADLGIVMTVEQYKHTYPEWVAIHTKQWGGDYTESLLGHGAMNMACLHLANGLSPKSVRP